MWSNFNDFKVWNFGKPKNGAEARLGLRLIKMNYIVKVRVRVIVSVAFCNISFVNR